ncbi:hypothetical protein [Limisalsivibrio acetivorans]|uniref:hypothetical protein n=1 Tax=Limisalsivibrio acetivorans TaxID=1304888 RepID=UPI0003B53936|nr:hypothetical protein [Limisalsivibrio acetivorans]
MLLKNANFALTTLSEDLDNSMNPSSLYMASDSDFPKSGRFRAVIWGGAHSTPLKDPEREIAELEYNGMGVFPLFNCYGGQEGTVSRSWPAGSKVAHVITAGKLDELESFIHEHANKAVIDGFSDVSGEVAYNGTELLKRAEALRITADYEMDGSVRCILADSSSSDIAVTLPDPSFYSGRLFFVKNTGTGMVTITRYSGEMIDGQQADITLSTQWDSRALISGGTNWYMV